MNKNENWPHSINGIFYVICLSIWCDIKFCENWKKNLIKVGNHCSKFDILLVCPDTFMSTWLYIIVCFIRISNLVLGKWDSNQVCRCSLIISTEALGLWFGVAIFEFGIWALSVRFLLKFWPSVQIFAKIS